MKSAIGILACAIWVGASSLASAAPLVADGGFESPIVTVGGFSNYVSGSTFGGSGSDWLVVGPAGEGVSVISGAFQQSGLNFVQQEGHQWIDLAGYNSNAANGVQQTIATTNGQAYNLSFWVGNVYDPQGFFKVSTTINVFINGNPFLTAVNTSSSNPDQYWQNFTGNFVATGPTTLAFISGDLPNDFVAGLDNVSVTLASTTTPLPAALPLFASGLGAMGFIGWRRKRKTKAALAAA